MKKCAIIGSEGYIGRHFNWYLKNMGIIAECYDIIDLARENYKRVNLTENQSLNQINFDVDYIFLFAGLTGTYVGFDDYEKFVNINEIGMLNLLNAIRKSSFRPKIIFPSTRLVYKGSEEKLDESAAKETKSIYAVNKLACEGFLDAYYKSFDIPYTVFRICIPFGNLLSNDYSYGTIGSFLRQVKENGIINIFGRGHNKRTFTSMSDLCFQLAIAGMDHRTTGEIYNIGGVVYTLKQAAEKIANHYNAIVREIDWPEKDLKIETGSTFFDSSKLEKITGFTDYKDISIILCDENTNN